MNWTTHLQFLTYIFFLSQKKKAPRNKNKQKRLTRGTSLETHVKADPPRVPIFKSILVDKIKKNLAESIKSNENTVSSESPDELKTVKPKKKLKTNSKPAQVSKQTNNNVKTTQTIKKKIKRLSAEKTIKESKPKVSKTTGLNKANETVKKTSGLNKANVNLKKTTGLNIANLKKQLAASLDSGQNSLRSRMLDKLTTARFRFLNEQMYTSEGSAAQQLFQTDPEAFDTYHEGYRHQVARWPVNPLDEIIADVCKLPADFHVVDLGCGDARLSRSVPQQVRSFDLVAAAEGVVACDMARVPVKNASADVAVYCLSLMGTNLRDYLLEANRMLKIGGILKIAEVESRFQSGPDEFVQALHKFGFRETRRDVSHQLFYFLDFVKEWVIRHKNKLPTDIYVSMLVLLTMSSQINFTY